MVISIDTEKGFNKIHLPFIMETLSRLEIGGSSSNKGHPQKKKKKIRVNITLVKVSALPLRSRIR